MYSVTMSSIRISELKRLPSMTPGYNYSVSYDILDDVEISVDSIYASRFVQSNLVGDIFQVNLSVPRDMISTLESQVNVAPILNEIDGTNVMVPITIRPERLIWKSKISYEYIKINYATKSIAIRLNGIIHYKLVCNENSRNNKHWILRGALTYGELLACYENGQWI